MFFPDTFCIENIFDFINIPIKAYVNGFSNGTIIEIFIFQLYIYFLKKTPNVSCSKEKNGLDPERETNPKLGSNLHPPSQIKLGCNRIQIHNNAEDYYVEIKMT
jgi:hypothetical protein